ncbi:MAG: glycosyltransferase, partial [bacterium]
DALSFRLQTLFRIVISKLFNYDVQRVRKNLSIFNSELTREQFQKLYGESSAEVIHPPVLMDASYRRNFADREDGFVYSGRVVRDKNLHGMIEFIQRVRASGADLHFHIVGPILDEAYQNELRRKYPFDWVTFEGNKNRTQLSEILGRHKYAIQARYLEPFGMAAAEACQMGCLTFVPRRCGMAEFIESQALKFADFDDLFHKFTALRQDPERQVGLSQTLSRRFSQFTKQRFQQQIQTVCLQAQEGRSAKGVLPKQVKDLALVDH